MSPLVIPPFRVNKIACTSAWNIIATFPRVWSNSIIKCSKNTPDLTSLTRWWRLSVILKDSCPFWSFVDYDRLCLLHDKGGNHMICWGLRTHSISLPEGGINRIKICVLEPWKFPNFTVTEPLKTPRIGIDRKNTTFDYRKRRKISFWNMRTLLDNGNGFPIIPAI